VRIRGIPDAVTPEMPVQQFAATVFHQKNGKAAGQAGKPEDELKIANRIGTRWQRVPGSVLLCRASLFPAGQKQ
jgi:hypothetical protein